MLLREVSRIFHQEPDKIEHNRTALLEALAARTAPEGKATIGLKELNGYAVQLGNAFDRVNGGLRGAPKFPQPSHLEMLWRAGQRTDDRRFFDTVTHTLERMSEAGSTIISAVASHAIRSTSAGSSRISRRCFTDNALLLELLALAYQQTGKALFCDPCQRNRRLAIARDDDSRWRVLRLPRCRLGRRGGQVLCLVASRDHIAAGESDAAFFAHHYDVTDDGNSRATRSSIGWPGIREPARTKRGSENCVANCSRRAKAASVLDWTTRFSPTGTG